MNEDATRFRMRMLTEPKASEFFVDFFSDLIAHNDVQYDPDKDVMHTQPPWLFGWPMPIPSRLLLSYYGDEEAIAQLIRRQVDHDQKGGDE
jgi:hypothetical protein